MNTFLTALQLTIAIVLMVAILIQSRGSGLGSAFGGASAVYRTKRGAEKMIFRGTIILGVLFFLVSLAAVFFA